MLIEAKEAIPHGEWAGWLARNTGLSARTARRYMQLSKSGLESATVADLGLRGATERLARASVRPTADLHNDSMTWRGDLFAELDKG